MRQAARSNDTKQKHIKAFEVMHSKRRRGGKQHARSRHPRRAWRKPDTKSPLTCTGVARGHRALTLYAPKIGNILLTGIDTAVLLSLRIPPRAARAMEVGLAYHSHDTA